MQKREGRGNDTNALYAVEWKGGRRKEAEGSVVERGGGGAVEWNQRKWMTTGRMCVAVVVVFGEYLALSW